MKKLLLTGICLIAATTARAECYGTGAYQTCYDARTGNSYSVQRIGSTTYVQGTNPYTGANWSETAGTIGNTTYIDGTSANGSPWNETIRHIGNSTYIDGTNSRGEPFSSSKYNSGI